MIGDITIFTFITVDNQAANNVAQEVWFETTHPKTGNIFVNVKGDEGAAELARGFNVTRYPTIIFARDQGNGQFLTLTRIVGNTSKQQVASTYLRLLNDPSFSEDNGGQGTGDIEPIIKGDQAGFGLGLLQLSSLAKWGLVLIVVGLIANSQKD